MGSRELTTALAVDEWRLIQGLLSNERLRLSLAEKFATDVDLDWWREVETARLAFVDSLQAKINALPLDDSE
jgi:hypothetical protein